MVAVIGWNVWEGTNNRICKSFLDIIMNVYQLFILISTFDRVTFIGSMLPLILGVQGLLQLVAIGLYSLWR